MDRVDGRKNDAIRQVKITRDYLMHPDGSVLIEIGNTKVICTAMIEDKVPGFLRGTGRGWVTSEYAMLPGSTSSRKHRDITKGKIDGRSQEIQRLVGRSLRSVTDLGEFGERTVWIDCDVIQADGGTRTASITGAFVAMVDAFDKLRRSGAIDLIPVKSFVSAISVGILNGERLLDLCYIEDSNAQVDMNVVMTDKGEFVELQGTGEESPFNYGDMLRMIDLAAEGCNQLYDIQKQALGTDLSSLIGKKPRRIILSTGNAHKVKEIKDILSGTSLQVISKDDVGLKELDIEEDGDTLKDNAFKKAEGISELVKGIVIADDTGLFVDALNGEPGVHSARYAKDNATDEDNRQKLLEELIDVPLEDRTARFKTVIAVVTESGERLMAEGVCEGTITLTPRGNKGFGYDSLFEAEDTGKTFAEMSESEKNKISHRARALLNLKEKLEELIGENTDCE